VSGAESWQNFYVMVGGAAAALTGPILVAVSLHLQANFDSYVREVLPDGRVRLDTMTLG